MADEEQETEQRTIDWASADVRDGSLTVRLEGEGSSEWSEQLEAVLRQLGSHGGSAHEVEVSEDEIKVAGVEPGGEDDVRHLLESAVQQVNASLAPDDEDDEDDADDGERSGEDREMTDAFRAFAPREEPAD